MVDGYKNRKMDMQRPIKFEGQYFGIETDSDFNDCFKEEFLPQSLAPFSDSTNLNTGCDPSAQIVSRMRINTSLALTPMTQLVTIARADADWKLANETQLRRTLRKTKLIQKRERAKNKKTNRGLIKIEQSKTIQMISVDRNEDIKKQKNRLSAQISRDRKKEHFLKLEQENEELKRNINQLTRSNYELQRRMARESQQPKKKGQNFLKTLLILLGIIFLLNLIRGTPSIKNEKSLPRFPISKIELTKHQRNFVHSQLKVLGVEVPLELMGKSRGETCIECELGNRLLQIKESLF